MRKPKFRWWKLIAVWVGFLLLHYSYSTFPGILFQILGEDQETTFFHMKMLFVAYTLVSLGEMVIRRGKLESKENFLFSRGLIAVVYPWLTITMWFTAEALGIHLPIVPWEIIYANVLTLMGIYAALRIEELFEAVQFRPAMKWVVILLFVTAVLSYVSFSINTPEHFFTTPPEFLH